jgi:glycosyltransferase involved in cell wall biosynthesis
MMVSELVPWGPILLDKAKRSGVLRILIVSNLYPPHYLGGAELLCKQIVDILARQHEIRVLTSDFRLANSKDGDSSVPVSRSLKLYRAFGEDSQKPLLRRWPSKIADRRNSRTTKVVLKDFEPELVFVWSQRRLGIGPALCAQRAGYPVAFIFNDDSASFFIPKRYPPGSLRSLLGFLLDHSLFRSNTTQALDLGASSCISQSLKTDMLAEGLPLSGSRVIHQGIPLSDFPCKAEPGSLGKPVRVLYVGQVLASKGVHTLLEAAELVAADRGPASIEVRIVGGGPEDYVEQLRACNKSGYRLDLAGRIAHDALPAVYRDHDIFVFPSIVKEGFGLTFLEAMASGLPVIGTITGGQGECLVDGVNALVFQAGDSAQLASCILRLVDDADFRIGIAKAARAMVERDYSLEVYAGKLEAFLEESRLGIKALQDPRAG